MANRNFPSSKMYTGHYMPVLVDTNFIVNSFDPSGNGISNLKGPFVQSVTMQSQTAGGDVPPGDTSLLTASSYAILAASTITSTGATVVTGNMGLAPGTSITGFPPGTVTGRTDVANAAATQAQLDATAAFNTYSAMPTTVIASDLGGQTLTAGAYSFATGAATLAASGNGTLTLSGSATDIFVIKTASTLGTGAGGVPTITLTGGALAANVFWIVGSSATLNIGVTAIGATFKGTVIAQASVTVTQASNVSGRLFALTAAVTLSAAVNVTSPNTTGPSHVSGTPGPGVIVVKLTDSFMKSYTGGHLVASPNSLLNLQIDNQALTPGAPYVITTVGNATAAKWIAMGVPAGVTPAVGVTFIAASTGGSVNTSTSRVQAPAPLGSAIVVLDVIGNNDKAVNPNPGAYQGFGSQIILQNHDSTGAIAAPVNGTLISLWFLIGNSSITTSGE